MYRFPNILACLLLPLSLLTGQEYIINTQFYGIEDGLSHRDVECIQQDRQGFIWLGTNYGLNRFDGYHFKWFTKEKNGLQSNIINHILQDGEGLLWLFYTKFRLFQAPQSIDLFNPETEEVLSFEEKFGKDLPFDLKDISSFTASPDGRLAFVTTRKKLILYSHEKGFEVSDVSIYPLFLGVFSKHNTIWGYTFKGDPSLKNVIVEIDLKGKELKRYEHDFPFQYNYIANVDSGDNLWYISKYWEHSRFEENQKGKIFKIDPKSGEKEFSLWQTSLPPGAVNLDISAAANEYGFWMNPDKSTFWLFGRGSFQGFHPSSGWYQELGAAHKELTSPNTVYFDNMDRAWVGTEFGLYVIELNKNPFRNIAHEYSKEDASTFRGITEDDQGTIWACIDRGFGWLARFKQKNNHYEGTITDWEKSDWGKGYKYGIFTDSKGFVWFGSGEDSVITKYNPADDTYRSFPHTIRRKTEEQQVNIWSFFEDKTGRVWFGSDVGIIGYVGQNQSVETFPELEGVNSKGGCIYQFFEDKKGKVWVASDGGLFLLDLKEKVIRLYASDNLSFAKEGIFHIHEDEDGTFWMGTKGLGLIHWQPGAEDYQQFTKADGLSNNTIYAVYEDDFDHLWLPSDYGIIQFNKRTHQSRAYLEKDGIANQEFNRISHFRSKSGGFFFGGLNGITSFYPNDLAKDSLSANIPLVVTGFEQFDGNKNLLIDKTTALRESNTITLKPADHFFRLVFALLTYTDVGNIQYAYFVEGVDKGWIYQKENSIRFSRLPYGQHLLHIKGQAPNGQWSKKELAIEIIVLRPFYLQTWFLIAAVFSLVAGAVIFYKWRVSNLKQRQRELEKTVADRTKEIVMDKLTIEQQAEELKSLEQVKSRFFANVSHELRTPLTLMLGPVDSLLKRKERDSEETKLLQFIQRNSRQLQKLINEILDLSKLEDKKMELTEEPVHFYPYLKEQLAQFHSAALSNEVSFRLKFHPDKSLHILLDKNKFGKIIHNFLSNAMKFTYKGDSVSLNVKDANEELQLSVCDTGRGIHPDDLPHVFDRFYQSRQPDAPTEGGTGIGLSLVMELAQLLGGRVWAESTLGKGSNFYFKFPKKEVGSFQSGSPQSALISMQSQLQQFEAGSPEFTEPSSRPLSIQPSSHSLKEQATILIVEDNPDLREYVQFLLSGYHVLTAENGKAALEILEARDEERDVRPLAPPSSPLTPDLIISDLMMPVMDGFQLLEILKSDDRWRHIPVIMLTAKADIRAKLDALRIGVDDYLTKPFQEEELKARIENMLHNYRERMVIFLQGNKSKNQAEGGEPAGPVKPVIAAVDAEWLKEVENIFTKYLSDSRLTVDFAAGKLNLSERQFHRRLKQFTGLAPNQYLQEIRLHRAKDFLVEGRFATVKEVAFAVGFQDVRYFSDLFEKHFEAKPSEMRK